MAFQSLTVTAVWPEAAQYTASGSSEIALFNPAIHPTRYIINATGTATTTGIKGLY